MFLFIIVGFAKLASTPYFLNYLFVNVIIERLMLYIPGHVLFQFVLEDMILEPSVLLLPEINEL